MGIWKFEKCNILHVLGYQILSVYGGKGRAIKNVDSFYANGNGEHCAVYGWSMLSEFTDGKVPRVCGRII